MKEAQLYASDEMLGFLRQPNLHELKRNGKWQIVAAQDNVVACI